MWKTMGAFGAVFCLWGGACSSSGPVSIALADVDGDGLLDALTADNYTNTMSVFFGLGSGVKGNAVRFPLGGERPIQILAGDLNGDGDTDAVVANFLTQDVSVLDNDGTGVFSLSSVIPTGRFSGHDGMSLGDVSGDGILDLAFADAQGEQVRIFVNDGNGSFTHGQILAVEPGGTALELGDLDGDFDLELIVTNEDGLHIFPNEGGLFGPPTKVLVPGGLFVSVGSEDFDQDGDLDIFVLENLLHRVVLLANDSGTLSVKSLTLTPPFLNHAVTGDFDGDSDPDIAIALLEQNQEELDVQLLLTEEGGLSFTRVKALSLGFGQGDRSLAAGDLNQDGVSDVAGVNSTTDIIHLFRSGFDAIR